jgi:Zn-dependent protease
MGLVTLLINEPVAFVALVVPLLYSIILHEVSHGWVAYWMGDDTAKMAGRLSLNPLKHLDPIGTLALLIVGFGWAKPVPVDYRKMKNLRGGIILVSFAGCLMNILIACMALFLLQLEPVSSNKFIAVILLVLARINILLGALNLIPIPPLDGSRILLGSLPPVGQRLLLRIEPYGLLILFGLIFTGLLDPVIAFMEGMIVFVIGKLLHFIQLIGILKY